MEEILKPDDIASVGADTNNITTKEEKTFDGIIADLQKDSDGNKEDISQNSSILPLSIIEDDFSSLDQDDVAISNSDYLKSISTISITPAAQLDDELPLIDLSDITSDDAIVNLNNATPNNSSNLPNLPLIIAEDNFNSLDPTTPLSPVNNISDISNIIPQEVADDLDAFSFGLGAISDEIPKNLFQSKLSDEEIKDEIGAFGFGLGTISDGVTEKEITEENEKNRTIFSEIHDNIYEYIDYPSRTLFDLMNRGNTVEEYNLGEFKVGDLPPAKYYAVTQTLSGLGPDWKVRENTVVLDSAKLPYKLSEDTVYTFSNNLEGDKSRAMSHTVDGVNVDGYTYSIYRLNFTNDIVSNNIFAEGDSGTLAFTAGASAMEFKYFPAYFMPPDLPKGVYGVGLGLDVRSRVGVMDYTGYFKYDNPNNGVKASGLLQYYKPVMAGVGIGGKVVTVLNDNEGSVLFHLTSDLAIAGIDVGFYVKVPALAGVVEQSITDYSKDVNMDSWFGSTLGALDPFPNDSGNNNNFYELPKLDLNSLYASKDTPFDVTGNNFLDINIPSTNLDTPLSDSYFNNDFSDIIDGSNSWGGETKTLINPEFDFNSSISLTNENFNISDSWNDDIDNLLGEDFFSDNDELSNKFDFTANYDSGSVTNYPSIFNS